VFPRICDTKARVLPDPLHLAATESASRIAAGARSRAIVLGDALASIRIIRGTVLLEVCTRRARSRPWVKGRLFVLFLRGRRSGAPVANMWVRGDFLASRATPQEERKKSEKTKMNTNLVVRCERQLSIALIRYTMTSVMTVVFHPVMLRQHRGGRWSPFRFVPRTV
jgi:hypothetical protein